MTAVTLTALLASMGGTAQAESVTTGGFEGYDTSIGIDGQDGWQKDGPYDANVVDPSLSPYGFDDMGSRALQISNAVVSGSFGDQTFSKPLADEAGESSAASDGMSGGTRQRVFTATFSVRTTSQAWQEGLYTSISPDRGDGARMSYLRLEDQPDGVHVFFDDYSHALGDFRETDIATLGRADKHSIGLKMVFLDGIANDVVRVSVDGSVVHTGTSWEDYFRDEEGRPTRTVDSLLFREGGASADARPGVAGRGFLIDDVQLTSSGSNSCTFTTTGTTKTLDGDCTTDHTIDVPDGFTLDGAGHTITAVEPAVGHWEGAVVQNLGSHASVINLDVTASDLTDACDGGLDRLAGIRLNGASGDLTNNTVAELNQANGTNGCQEGNAIDVRNTAGAPRQTVTLTGNDVDDYQKTGILITGDVSAIVDNNTVRGYGPVDYIAQNGVQVTDGATARVSNNEISDNYYSPKFYWACGLLISQTNGVRVEKNNVFSGNEKDICTNSKGGTYAG